MLWICEEQSARILCWLSLFQYISPHENDGFHFTRERDDASKNIQKADFKELNWRDQYATAALTASQRLDSKIVIRQDGRKTLVQGNVHVKMTD